MFRAWGLEIGRGLLSWQVKGAVASVATGFCGGIWLAERIGSAGETVTETGRLACTPKNYQQAETQASHTFSRSKLAAAFMEKSCCSTSSEIPRG